MLVRTARSAFVSVVRSHSRMFRGDPIQPNSVGGAVYRTDKLSFSYVHTVSGIPRGTLS